jgi:hypothetical protein
MYFRMTHNWEIAVKTPHMFRLELREGLFRDTLRLFVDDELMTTGTASTLNPNGVRLFDVDGRTFELKWEWHRWLGDPKSIVLMHKGRILARYGGDSAAKIDFDDFLDEFEK